MAEDLTFLLKRLESKHEKLHEEINFLESQRDLDRSYMALSNLKTLKKQKLQLKDAIAALKKQMDNANGIWV